MPVLDFNLSEIKVSNYSKLPHGVYNAVIVKSEFDTTAKGDKYLRLDWTVTDGDHAGLTVLQSLNTHNSSEKAREIARIELARIALAALGNTNIQTTEQLHNIQMQILIIEDGTFDKNGNANSEIKRAYAANETVVVPPKVQSSTPTTKPVSKPAPKDDTPPAWIAKATPPAEEAPSAEEEAVADLPNPEEEAPAKGKMPWEK